MAQQSAFRPQRAGAIVCALTAGLLGSGCAQQSELPVPDLLSSFDTPTASPVAGSPSPAGSTGGPITEKQLTEATAFWGKRYAEAPANLKAALSYASNLKAMGQKQQALAVLQQASVYHADNRELAGEYGRLALELGQIKAAEKLLAFADDPGAPDWRIISARGTVLAKQGKYAESVPMFERALILSHDHPSLLNNLAMAHVMLGDAQKAEGLLRRAADSKANDAKVQQNLALVLGLQGKYQESTQVAAQVMPPAAAAQETAYLRKLTKAGPVTPGSDPAVKVASGELRGSTAPSPAASSAWDSKVVAAGN